ncbi:MAG TPA: hypothetical protein VLD18_10730, partial [Verrucomicrobiae bacterium]|nr:hypothetical protein [Verrucomicrobiae bacterium]
MNRLKTLLAILVTFALAGPSRADILELRSGTILNGKYVGGTGATVRFEALGNLQVIATSDIIALTFTSSGGNAAAPVAVPATPPPASEPPPAAAASSKQVTLPAGTMLLVRMKDGISSKNKPGTPFTTKIEYDLFVGGTKVVPAGA